MKILLNILLGILTVQLAHAQSKSISIPMNSTHWNIPADAQFEQFDNRETLVLTTGRATVKGQNFTNGTIEVEVYAKASRSFAGISFREENNNLEEVYMRLHKSGQADAVQYTPMFNNESNWQLYREHQANVTFKANGWNKLRLEVQNQRVEVFINGSYAMTVEQMKTSQKEGQIGLWALFGNRFSNFKVTHSAVDKSTQEKPKTPTDPTIISSWQITSAQSFHKEKLDYELLAEAEYTSVTTEESGLLPISKYVKKTSSGGFEQNKEDFIVAKTTIHSEEAANKLFSFDYSDKIIIYLNGEAIFSGDNSFRLKGVQFMGHLNIDANTLYLPLKKGGNIIHCVVIDQANGWGLIGKIE
ncbi:MAG: DUF1080 domain-containing protein [Roseivirga sp.]|uniref:family 16 glycoside hydrolase n=1 Tax=Roseivirga sp. TaxID=1964215 RepID=UPI001B0BB970|nr:family 16 glycoside hydrolase [Roseivirga sp.]MBO6659405.1 DUF1080 domain-containing protein [Roseivirga sp.]MBO6907858.1 DUF1080 domain-containing protein [Roseivirga sp.]